MTLLAYEPFQDRLTPGDTREVRFQPNDVASLAIDVQSLGALFRIFEEPPPFERDGDDAVLTVRGPLTHHAGWFDSYDSIRSRFDAAIASDAKRVVMRLDSPGGYVSGCFETARYIESKVKASGKKLVARIEGQATSAAYALACAADEIVATPTSIVGSIGVIRLVTDMTRAAEGVGMRFHVLTSGARKADGHPLKEPTESGLQTMQAEVDELAGVFFAWVAERRPSMTLASIRGLEAGIRIGESSRRDGLVDRIENGSMPLDVSGAVTGDAVASPKEKSTMDKAIMQALGCAEDATEAAVLASATKIVGERDALLAALGVENVDQAKGAVEAYKADKAALAASNAKLAEINAAIAHREHEELIAQASKLFSPAKMETLKNESTEFLRKFVSMATPDIRPESMGATEPKVGAVLTASQKKAAKSAGLTEEEFAAELRNSDGGAQ